MISDILSLIAAVVSVIGAIVAVARVRPEKKKLEAEGLESIGAAAENIADGANMTVGFFRQAMQQMEEHNKKEREEFRKEIEMLQKKINALHERLSFEKTARVRAERKINALQAYIEQLKDVMKKANLTPPPFVYHEQE